MGVASESRQDTFRNLYRAGIDFAQNGKHAEAQLAFSKAVLFAPELWCDLATQLARDGCEDMALDHFRTALTSCPHPFIRSGIFTNIANIYAKRDQLKQAIQMVEMALKENPENADAFTNLGQIRKWQGNIEASNRYADKALAINPWHNEAQFLKALNALDSGDYTSGWPLYECRWRSSTNGNRRLEVHYPDWSGPGATFMGKPLKRLFVYGEQGAGDIILMLRYAPLIRAAGMWQSWAVKPRMASLAALLVDDAREDATTPNEFDCHIPSASLPLIFKTTQENIPKAPYLPRPEAATFDGNFNVGIVWRGQSAQFNDNIRSTRLDDWSPVFEAGKGKAKFWSLQVDSPEEGFFYPELNQLPPAASWLETASRLTGLDLLISVDTGIVHLAGALGVPCWCALHCRPYFVYPINRQNSPWYPDVKLFKQTKAFEWKPVFESIAAELCKTLS